MSSGYVYVLGVPFCSNKKATEMLYYISAWASALLVQTELGNARASKSGTSNRYRFPRFFFLYTSSIYYMNIRVGSLRAT